MELFAFVPCLLMKIMARGVVVTPSALGRDFQGKNHSRPDTDYTSVCEFPFSIAAVFIFSVAKCL